tara:strand:+ start:663 stop:833 length:171 start_codon:yes stop_codon:yes gene_type:complete
MLAVNADHSRWIFMKKFAAAMKMAMKMNCLAKTVALPARFALKKVIAICCQRNQHV